MKTCLYLGFLILTIFSCSSPKIQKEELSDLSFELDSRVKAFDMPEGWGHFYLGFQNVKDRIYFFNHRKFSVAAFDKESQEMIFLTEFEKEGPNGVDGQVIDFQIDDEGNILFYASNDKLYKMNPHGELVEKVSLQTSELVDNNIAILPNNFQKIENLLYFPAFPMIFKWTDLSVDELAALPNLIVYNLEDHSYEKLSFFDRTYLGNNLNKFIMPTLGIGKNGEMIINHNYKDIFVYHKGEVINVEASLTGFSPDPPVSQKDMFEEMDEIMRLMNHTDNYLNFAFYPHHNIYIRTAKFEEAPEGDDFMGTFMPSKWALVFLDEQFKKVGELNLPEKETNGNYIFDTKEGIWFSTDHPDNPDLDEDKLQFRLLLKK
ncbi:DUF4221 family protein [Belliella marina]|uniref:DUF4221 family protein n=1 Tax=Belliella marina TaxID=1644146 RepID=A0ABW4VTI6_9BACT